MSLLRISNDPDNKSPTRIDVEIEYTQLKDDIEEKQTWSRKNLKITGDEAEIISVNDLVKISTIQVHIFYDNYMYTYTYFEGGRVTYYYKSYNKVIHISISKGTTRPIVKVNDTSASSCSEDSGLFCGNEFCGTKNNLFLFSVVCCFLPCPCFCYAACCIKSPYLENDGEIYQEIGG